jgi:hypothetical protein
MSNAAGMQIFSCFEDLEDYELCIEVVKTTFMNMKDEIVKVTAAKKGFENDKGRWCLNSREYINDTRLKSDLRRKGKHD